MLRPSDTLRRVFLVGWALLGATATAHADILLSDDFNSNALDPTKWSTVLPFGNSSVVDQNQRAELANRGYLVTRAEFNPAALGGIRIQGQYTFLNTDPFAFDFLQIVTRTAAVPTSPFGETSQGLSFTIRGDDQLRIHDRSTGATLAGPIPFPIQAGEAVNFQILDDGLHASFLVQEVGGAGASASLSLTSSIASPVNHVAFYNREYLTGPNVGYLDNVIIDRPTIAPPPPAAVPEPSTVALLGAGAVFLALRRLAGARSSREPLRGIR